MPQVQTNTTKIIESIGAYHKRGERPDDMARQRFVRDIDKLPTEFERLHARGVLEAVCGNGDVAFQIFEKALEYPEGYRACHNYWVALKSLASASEATKKGYEIAELSSLFSIWNELLIRSAIMLDVENLKRCHEVLRKAKKFDDDLIAEQALDEVNTMEQFLNHSTLTAEQLNQIGEVAFDLLSEKKIEIRGNHVAHKKQRDHLSVEYVISADSINADELFDLNFEFAGRLVERELDKLPVVAQFQRREIDMTESEELANAG